MTTTQEKMISIEVSPEDVTSSLPSNFTGSKNSGEGFSDHQLSVPFKNDHISYMISYDGEGELLARILIKPSDVSEEQCENLLKGFFMSDDEDEEDSDDEE